MSSFLDLPDELILKVFTYTETVDLLSCAQVSKRIRTISFDNSLLQTVNLRNVNVKTDLLATLLNKGCKSLKLSDCSLLGDLTLIPKSQLKILDYRNCRILAYSRTIRYKNRWQVVNKNSQKLQKKVNQTSTMTMILQKTNETPPLIRILFLLNTEKIHRSKIAT